MYFLSRDSISSSQQRYELQKQIDVDTIIILK